MTRPVALLLAVGLTITTAHAASDPAAKAYLAGDLSAARKLLEREIGRGQVRPSRYLLLGRVYAMQKQWANAERTLKKLRTLDPENPHADELLGRALFHLKKHKEAEPLYEKAVTETGRPELRIEYAEVLTALNRRNDAVGILKKVITDNRTWPRAHYLLGKLRLESGLGHWASHQLWVALKSGCTEPHLHTLLADAFLLEGRITGPLTLNGPFKNATVGDMTEKHILVRSAGRDRPGFWFVAGPDTALYQAVVVLREHPADTAARLRVASCWLTAGDAPHAEQVLTTLGRRTPGIRALRTDIALARRDLDSFDKLFKKIPSKELPAEQRVAYLLKATLIAQVDANPTRAHEFLQTADSLLPGRSDVLRLTVDVLTQLGKHQEAKAKMQLLAELHPDSPEIRLLAKRHRIEMRK